jgi:hypothetical protein
LQRLPIQRALGHWVYQAQYLYFFTYNVWAAVDLSAAAGYLVRLLSGKNRFRQLWAACAAIDGGSSARESVAAYVRAGLTAEADRHRFAADTLIGLLKLAVECLSKFFHTHSLFVNK